MKLSDLKAERDNLNSERNEHLEARSGHDKRARELAKSITHIEKQIILAYERGETDQQTQAQSTAAPSQVTASPLQTTETQSPAPAPTTNHRQRKTTVTVS